MAATRLPSWVRTAFFAGGGVIVALLAYAASLRSENQRLRERLGEEGIEGRGASDGESASNTEGRSEGSTQAEGTAPPAEPTRPLEESSLTGLTTALRAVQATDRRVWLTSSYGDADAAERATALGRAFEQAGFTVARSDVARFPIRPGLHFMMADAEPAEAVQDILAAVEATGATVTSGRGYRDFYDERKRDDPSWNGFPMDDDQSYVIAVGRE